MHSGKPTQFAFELKLLFFYFFVFLALSRKSVATCLFKLPFEWNATRITFAIPKCKFTTVYTFNRLNFIMARENYLVYNCFQCKWLFSFCLGIFLQESKKMPHYAYNFPKYMKYLSNRYWYVTKLSLNFDSLNSQVK